MTNKEIAQLLRNVGVAIRLKDDGSDKNIRFRIMAYDRAAETVEQMSESLSHLASQNTQLKIAGIGSVIGTALYELLKNGTSPHFNSLLEGIPPTVFQLMQVPGIGPKKAFRLVMQFGLTDENSLFTGLRAHCQNGDVAQLEGFGEKSQKDIIANIQIYEKRAAMPERKLISEASKIAAIFIEYLQPFTGVKRIDLLGSLRRRTATIGDIDIAVMADDKDSRAIVSHFLTHPMIDSVVAKGDAKASIFTHEGMRIDLRVQQEATYGTMLQYFTGSKAHNIALREHALGLQWSLNEYGLTRMSSSSNAQQLSSKMRDVTKADKIFSSEEKLYSFLGLQYIPPEIREGTDEVEMAKRNTIPHLLELSDMKGDLHIHCDFEFPTSHDLGKSSPQELAMQAKSLHYEYVGITDHNPRQTGLRANNIVTITKKRKQYIDQLIVTTGVHHVIGYEVDILPDGEIAFPQECIPFVDYLIVSLHSSFKMHSSDMTKRILRALTFPKVRIFGHPTGRLVNERAGVDADWGTIFREIKDRDIAMEINASPHRLDLPDTLVRQAALAGVRFVIDSDAHASKDMNVMKYGVDVARRGWLTKEQVRNTLPFKEFKKWLVKN